MRVDLRASAIQIDITPPIGVAMEGYAARDSVSNSVHDPLRAQLLLLESGVDRVALIAMDLLGIRLSITQRIRAGIEDAIDISPDAVMLACTHTHSGPAGFLPDVPGLHSTSDLELQSMLVHKLIHAAAEAECRLQPARLGVASGRVQGLGANRNDPRDGLFDDEVIVVRVDDHDSNPLALVMNYGCHPTVMGHENLSLSADFPGATRDALASIYPETVFIFTNGASGDVSTRFTRNEQSFREVERLGRILSGEVHKVMQTIKTDGGLNLAHRLEDIRFPLRTLPNEEQATAKIKELEGKLEMMKSTQVSHGEMRRIFTQWQGAVGQAEMAKALSGKLEIPTQLQLLTIGCLAFVGIPGEPFTRTVLEIKERSPFNNTAVVSYCNDEVGYFPDSKAFETETYEALISPYREDVASMLRERVLAALEEASHVRH